MTTKMMPGASVEENFEWAKSELMRALKCEESQAEMILHSIAAYVLRELGEELGL